MQSSHFGVTCDLLCHLAITTNTLGTTTNTLGTTTNTLGTTTNTLGTTTNTLGTTTSTWKISQNMYRWCGTNVLYARVAGDSRTFILELGCTNAAVGPTKDLHWAYFPHILKVKVINDAPARFQLCILFPILLNCSLTTSLKLLRKLEISCILRLFWATCSNRLFLWCYPIHLRQYRSNNSASQSFIDVHHIFLVEFKLALFTRLHLFQHRYRLVFHKNRCWVIICFRLLYYPSAFHPLLSWTIIIMVEMAVVEIGWLPHR